MKNSLAKITLQEIAFVEGTNTIVRHKKVALDILRRRINFLKAINN